MDDKEELTAKRAEQLGFKPQKELSYNILLPYNDRLDEESKLMFAEIKANLGKAVILRELRPACGIWVSRLIRYIQLYGFKFSKEDHIMLIKLMYECITIPDLEPNHVQKFGRSLHVLLKKRHWLSREDLTLDWRPLYEITRRILDTSESQLGMYRYFPQLDQTLENLIKVAQFYFPDSATQEILDEFKFRIYPLSGANADFLDVFDWFLPMGLPPDKAHLGYKLWFTDIMDIWAACNNGPIWEMEVVGLIAKLASHNVGLIDWEPYIPDMFARLTASLNLPVNYKNDAKKMRKMDTSSLGLWIVSTLGGGSSTQAYLDKFLKAVETYFHPANAGRWLLKLKDLLWRLPQYFVTRLHVERFQKPSWVNQVPDSHKLTEEDIDHFVESIKPVAMQAIFSRFGCADVIIAMQHLATLRPKSICPDLIEKLYVTLDSVTEPHKLTSILQAIVGVARPLLEGPSNGYKEGPSQVIPMLMATLPGIDPNDFRKCVVTFQFLQSFVTLVPLVDCSKAFETWTDLTEDEEDLCLQTAGFEDFVCQFFDRIFVLVESSTLESTRLDKKENKRSRLENLSEKTIVSVSHTILTQSSNEIFQSALKKLVTFVTERILETQVAGPMVASLCGAFARVNSKETLKALLPRLCDNILTLTDSEDVQKEHDLDNELLYNLLVLSVMVECRREGLVPYMEKLTQVLDRCLFLVSKEAHGYASQLLSNLFITLTSICVTEQRSLNYEFKTGDTERLAIRDWGKSDNLHSLKINWHVPNAEEVAAAQALLTRYLLPELGKLELHINGSDVMTRTRLLISLKILYATLSADSMLSLWDEEPLMLIESLLPISHFTATTGNSFWLKLPDGRNVRLVLAQAMDKLQKNLLETAEDHTEAFFILIKISEKLLLNRMRSGSDYEMHYKSHNMAKKILTNPLVKGKSRVRSLWLDRAMLQHEMRCEKAAVCLTPTHKLIMLNMLTLSCSHYSQVRTKAQAALGRGVEYFAYSYLVLIPQLVSNLKLNPADSHETIKGSLYAILGPKTLPIVSRHDWSTLLELWPALIRSMPSEKLSVVQLLESLKDIVGKFFPTITIKLEVPERCVEAGRRLWNEGLSPASAPPTPSEEKLGVEKLVQRGETNQSLYLKLLDVLVDAAEDNSLHWRHHSIAVCFIRDLVHPEVLFPPRVVKLFLDTMLHESIELRKIAIRSSVHVLKQQKRPHRKLKIDVSTLCSEPPPSSPRPGIRPDNIWLQYNSQTVPQSQRDWDAPRFHHGVGFGYLQMPSVIDVYAPSNQQPPLDRTSDDLSPEEKVVYEFFSNLENISKLIKYFSLEDEKGKDKFNGFRFILFKGLFRNYGDTFLPLFQPHLVRLVNEKQESSQRCATEIIAGLVRGCKHWPYHKVETLWSYLVPLIQNALKNMTSETIQDWGICFATSSQNRDPNRNHWLLECLMDDPLRNETSFMECGRLYVLQSALNQQEWRVSELMSRVLTIIKPFLDHPFQDVRRRIASVLANIFQPDLQIQGGRTLGPRMCDFMAEMLPKLEILYELPFTTAEHKDKKPRMDMTAVNNAIKTMGLSEPTKEEIVASSPTDSALRLFKTLVQWITGALLRSSSGVLPEYYSIYPLACLLVSYDQDEEIGPICSKMLSALAAIPLNARNVDSALAAINKVAESKSWWARSTNLEFLQVVIFHSLPILRSNSQWAAHPSKIVLNGLKDQRVEVREKAAEVLSGLLHCDFISDQSILLKDFIRRLRKSDRQSREPNQLREMHSAVLGLCAFVNSSPYDVPDFVPRIFPELGDHLNDPQPIPSTIRKTLGDFKRTHHDNWESHKLKFTDEQLDVLSDLTVPPSYCV